MTQKLDGPAVFGLAVLLAIAGLIITLGVVVPIVYG